MSSAWVPRSTILPSTTASMTSARVMVDNRWEITQDVRDLSGGNKQKVVFGKWLGNESDIFILDCPTRGIDIGVKAFMYQLMYKLKQEGKAIIMISEELPELIGMSDRILIMKDGEIRKEFERSETLTESELIREMV